jgi:hypothetical protein
MRHARWRGLPNSRGGSYVVHPASHRKEKRVKQVIDTSRRRLLRNVALGVLLIPIARAPVETAGAADAPLVTADDPTAKALKYTADASKASDAKPGSKCANCRFYQGAADSAQGGCLIFPGKSVKAAGWCSSWTAKA